MTVPAAGGDSIVRAEEPTVLGSQEFYNLRPTDLFLPFSVDTAIVVLGPIDPERLKHALARALSLFPLYAGRLERVGDSWRVRLTNDGALFHVRQSQEATPPIGPDAPVVLAPFNLTLQINHWNLYSGKSEEALLRLTLTLGTNWSVVGFSGSHVVGDGYGVALFMRAVSRLYQNLQPEDDIAYSYPPNPETVPAEIEIETPWLDRYLPLPSATKSSTNSHPKTLRIDLRLSTSQLTQIRKAILALGPAEPGAVSLSLQDCLVSALTVALNRVHAEHNEPLITRATTIVNYRGVEPVPRVAACNALIQAVADLPSTSTPSSPSFAYDLATSIRRSLLLSRNPEHVQATVAVNGNKFAAPANATPQLSLDFSSVSGALNVNSTRPFDWTKAHFGYEGQARFFHTCSDAARYIKIFTPNPTLLPDGTWKSNQGAAEVVFYLEPHLREPFMHEFVNVMRDFGVEGGPEYVAV
ncbi:hypothetical protein AURDEDRAFT_184740 [Auricularia subglabra TFB-10046 SS5]|nr:hypothetical protein AURDEDRAFT_184740 [Auricularia subglabra TFB-10046 SS5]